MKKIIPIRPKSAEELAKMIQKIDNKADIIEIWLDRNADELIPVIKKIRSETHQAPDAPKFLAVCKTPEEKGIFLGSMEQKLSILQKFLDAGGEYIDVDFGRFPERLTDQLPSEKLWISWHDFYGLPKNIESIVQNTCSKKPFLIKLAVTCNTEEELNTFIKFVKNIHSIRRTNSTSLPETHQDLKTNCNLSLPKTESQKFCFTTMGEFGGMGRKILREENLTWGEFYALDEKSKTAAGQSVLFTI